MKVGRPTIYTEDLGNLICQRLAEGESLNRICQDDNLPWRSTVIRWALDEDHEFCDKYARARQIQSECLADDIFDIADGDGDVQRDRLKVDARKWYLYSVVPRFKPKQEIDHAGGVTVVLHKDG